MSAWGSGSSSLELPCLWANWHVLNWLPALPPAPPPPLESGEPSPGSASAPVCPWPGPAPLSLFPHLQKSYKAPEPISEGEPGRVSRAVWEKSVQRMAQHATVCVHGLPEPRSGPVGLGLYLLHFQAAELQAGWG